MCMCMCVCVCVHVHVCVCALNRSRGYKYMLTQKSLFLPPTEGCWGNCTVLTTSNQELRDPVSMTMTIGLGFVDDTSAPPWTLYIEPESGWGRAWEVPMYVVICVVTTVLSALLLAVLVSR